MNYNILYCPRCGLVASERSRHVGNCDCKRDISLTDFKERKNAKFILTDHKLEDWPHSFPYDYSIPETAFSITQEMCEFIWSTYVDIPENDKLNREAFEKEKAETIAIFARGGAIGPGLDLRDSKPKSASVVGRAVAGGIIAGPTGAVVGAASAIDKNMKEKK